MTAHMIRADFTGRSSGGGGVRRGAYGAGLSGVAGKGGCFGARVRAGVGVPYDSGFGFRGGLLDVGAGG